MHRSAGIALVSALIVASCASTSPAPPTPSVAVPSVTPSALASPIPTSSPTSSSSVAPSAAPTPSEPPPTPTATARPTAANFFGLANARLDLPGRPKSLDTCPHGKRTKFTKGRSGEMTVIGFAVEADIDRDGDDDVVAGIDCAPGEGFFRQLIAFHRGADGKFSTIGLVVQAGGSGGENRIDNVYDAKVSAGGAIRVEVGDYNTRATDGSNNAVGVHQIRTYDWNGTKFVQTAGSTSFIVPPGTVNLAVDVSPMTYAKPAKGKRAGTLTVTIRNDGSAVVRKITVVLATSIASTYPTCTPPGGSKVPCAIARLDPGATRTVTFYHTIIDEDPLDPGDPNAFRQVRIGDRSYSIDSGVSFVYE